MSDSIRWAKSSDGQLYDIGKSWAKKYSIKKLRSFQASYTNSLRKSNDDLTAQAYQARIKAVTWAIDIKAFPELHTGTR